jgi:hypothetical protein
MLAHTQGTTLNQARLAASLGLSSPAIGRYIDVLVDLDEGDRAAADERAQHRNRDGVVAAEHDRHGAGGEDLAHHLLGALDVAFEIANVGTNIAAVHRTDRLACIERAAEVEIVALEAAR